MPVLPGGWITRGPLPEVSARTFLSIVYLYVIFNGGMHRGSTARHSILMLGSLQILTPPEVRQDSLLLGEQPRLMELQLAWAWRWPGSQARLFVFLAELASIPRGQVLEYGGMLDVSAPGLHETSSVPWDTLGRSLNLF